MVTGKKFRLAAAVVVVADVDLLVVDVLRLAADADLLVVLHAVVARHHAASLVRADDGFLSVFRKKFLTHATKLFVKKFLTLTQSQRLVRNSERRLSTFASRFRNRFLTPTQLTCVDRNSEARLLRLPVRFRNRFLIPTLFACSVRNSELEL